MPKVPNVTELPANGSVFPLQGEIDLHVSPAIAISLQEIIAKKPARLLVDLSRVTYLDSSGLAVLIDAMQKVKKYGGTFGIVGMQESVRSIFEIAKLDQVFRIFPSVEAADAAT
jgi:anti-sigma B factor antagonist